MLSHFTDEGTEVQKGEVTPSRSHMPTWQSQHGNLACLCPGLHLELLGYSSPLLTQTRWLFSELTQGHAGLEQGLGLLLHLAGKLRFVP